MTSATGIPIEYMFEALGILLGVIYAGIAAQLRSLQKGSTRRDRLLILICDKLNIPCNLGD
jgi:hypothetical protein